MKTLHFIAPIIPPCVIVSLAMAYYTYDCNWLESFWWGLVAVMFVLLLAICSAMDDMRKDAEG